MAEVSEFDTDASLPDHKRQVAAPFAALATDLSGRFPNHPHLDTALDHLLGARDLMFGAAHDRHTDEGHPGGGNRAGMHEPVTQVPVYRATDSSDDAASGAGGQQRSGTGQRMDTEPPTGPADTDRADVHSDGSGESIRQGEPVTLERADPADHPLRG